LYNTFFSFLVLTEVILLVIVHVLLGTG